MTLKTEHSAIERQWMVLAIQYQHEILKNGQMIATRSTIFAKLGEKLDKIPKAVYLMLKRAHERSSISQNIELPDEIPPRNDKSPESVDPHAETKELPSLQKKAMKL